MRVDLGRVVRECDGGDNASHCIARRVAIHDLGVIQNQQAKALFACFALAGGNAMLCEPRSLDFDI